jgi:phosphoribosyl 1,2-cyclic phosphate phosphodiesterase
VRVTLLGTGGSAGVPLVSPDPGGFWGACDPADPRNRRTRTSALVEVSGRRILIDAGPDLRTQLLLAGAPGLDAVLFTHAHADHVAGIDDLRQVNRIIGAPIPAYADAGTMAELHERFAYALAPHAGGHFARPVLVPQVIMPGEKFQAAGVEVLPLRQDHGFGPSLGFRIGNFAYSTDVLRLDEAAFGALSGLELWVVGCFRRSWHPGHATLDEVCGWIARLRPRRTVLTQMGEDLDFLATAAALPAGAEPGFDGWSAQVPDPGQKVP